MKRDRVTTCYAPFASMTQTTHHVLKFKLAVAQRHHCNALYKLENTLTKLNTKPDVLTIILEAIANPEEIIVAGADSSIQQGMDKQQII